MDDDAKRKLAAHQSLYAALAEVETGHRFGTEFVESDDVLTWAQGIAESHERWLASRYDDQASADHSAEQDEHVKAWRAWRTAHKQAAE